MLQCPILSLTVHGDGYMFIGDQFACERIDGGANANVAITECIIVVEETELPAEASAALKEGAAVRHIRRCLEIGIVKIERSVENDPKRPFREFRRWRQNSRLCRSGLRPTKIVSEKYGCGDDYRKKSTNRTVHLSVDLQTARFYNGRSTKREDIGSRRQRTHVRAYGIGTGKLIDIYHAKDLPAHQIIYEQDRVTRFDQFVVDLNTVECRIGSRFADSNRTFRIDQASTTLLTKPGEAEITVLQRDRNIRCAPPERVDRNGRAAIVTERRNQRKVLQYALRQCCMTGVLHDLFTTNDLPRYNGPSGTSSVLLKRITALYVRIDACRHRLRRLNAKRDRNVIGLIRHHHRGYCDQG